MFIILCFLNINLPIDISLNLKCLILSISYYLFLLRNDRIHKNKLEILKRSHTREQRSTNDNENNEWKSMIDVKDCQISMQFARIVDSKYALYRITITHLSRRWHIWRRISEFDNLNTVLQTDYHGKPMIPLLILSGNGNHFHEQYSHIISDVDTPKTIAWLRNIQIQMIDWLLLIKETPVIANHHEVRYYIYIYIYIYLYIKQNNNLYVKYTYTTL
jgi:hypothetical protein